VFLICHAPLFPCLACLSVYLNLCASVVGCWSLFKCYTAILSILTVFLSLGFWISCPIPCITLLPLVLACFVCFFVCLFWTAYLYMALACTLDYASGLPSNKAAFGSTSTSLRAVHNMFTLLCYPWEIFLGSIVFSAMLMILSSIFRRAPMKCTNSQN